MDKYKKLMFNTLIFGISTFSSKLLVFFLMPYYTSVMSESEFGTANLIIVTANMLAPLVSLGMANAAIRFGLDKEYDKRDVLSNCLKMFFVGAAVMLLLWLVGFQTPMKRALGYESFTPYSILVVVFVFMSSLRLICAQFVRSCEKVKLFAADGLLSTALVIGFSILFLSRFNMGITGYVLAIIVADGISSAFLFAAGRLKKFIKFKKINPATSKAMLIYALPLIPTALFWSITNSSDQLVVSAFLGPAANGLYAVSYKIPYAVTMVSEIFSNAWQMSAILEKNSEDIESFFSKVFNMYQALLFLCGSVLIAASKMIMKILVSDEFYSAWTFIPVLVMATVFSCFVTFFGSIYVIEKNSKMSFITMAVGAGVNIVLNITLIMVMKSAQAVAIATFVSYFLVFIIRVAHTRKYVKVRFNCVIFILNMLILAVQSFLMIKEVPYWPVYEILLTVVVLALNGKFLLNAALKLLNRKTAANDL